MPKPKLTPTNIEWTDFVWNAMSGCTKLTDGCKNCYAADMAKRLQRIQETTGKDLGYVDGFSVTLHPERLETPLKHKKSAKIFVNSMGDLFHEDVENLYIFQTIGIMKKCPQHIFQVLTKRPKRLQWAIRYERDHAVLINSKSEEEFIKTIQHIWLGVTIESVEHKDRLDILRQTPTAIRFLSLEPLLSDLGELNLDGIDWVIVGGETGKGARPMHPDWVKSIQKQCEIAGVSFFFKQWGEWMTLPEGKSVSGWKTHFWPDGRQAVRVGKRQAGHLLDGKEHREYPSTQGTTI